MPVFEGQKYYISSSVPQERQAELIISLDQNGGSQCTSLDDENLTVVVTNANEFDGRMKVGKKVAIVTDYWVDRSLLLGKLQETQYYSPDPAMLFSGVVACSTDFTPSDNEVLQAGILAFGGQWRNGYLRDVTHLFAPGAGSDKYRTALFHQVDTHVKVVTPHWFDDSVRLGIRNLPTDVYEWPEPEILKVGRRYSGIKKVLGEQEGKRELSKATGEDWMKAMTAERRAVLKGLVAEGNVEVSGRDVWGGKRVLLSKELEFSELRRRTVEDGIRLCGGDVVELSEGDDEVDLVDDADVLVTTYRWGEPYIKAVRKNKLVGSLTWLLHVEHTGVLSAPTSQLLHHPIPKGKVERMAQEEITVSNYTGEGRDYLKKLVMILGAKFTASMTQKNTVLVAAFIDGNKTTKAANWSMPIVNHTWLEDCFIHWKYISPAHEKYISFPPSMNFAQLLGDRGLSGAALKASLKEVEAQMEEERREAAAGVDVEMNDVICEEMVGEEQGEMEIPDAVAVQEEEDVVEDVRSAPSAKARGKKAQRQEDVIEIEDDEEAEVEELPPPRPRARNGRFSSSQTKDAAVEPEERGRPISRKRKSRGQEEEEEPHPRPASVPSTRRKSKGEPVEMDEEDEHDEHADPASTNRTPLRKYGRSKSTRLAEFRSPASVSPNKRTPTRKAAPKSFAPEESSSEEELPPVVSVSARTPRTPSRSKRQQPDSDAYTEPEPEPEEDEVNRQLRRSGRLSQGTTPTSKHATHSKNDEVSPSRPSGFKTQTPRRRLSVVLPPIGTGASGGRGRSRSRARAEGSTASVASPSKPQSAAAPKETAAKPKSKPKSVSRSRRAQAQRDGDSDDEPISIPASTAPKGIVKPKSKPKPRSVSRSRRAERDEDSDDEQGPVRGPEPGSESEREAESEPEPVASTSRGRPPRRKSMPEVVIPVRAVSPTSEQRTSATPIGRSGPRRSAAIKASGKLERTMKDVVNYEKQKKSGTIKAIGEGKDIYVDRKGKGRDSLGVGSRRRASMAASDDSEEEDEDVRGKQGKKRRMSAAKDRDDESGTKKARTSINSRRNRAQSDSEEDVQASMSKGKAKQDESGGRKKIVHSKIQEEINGGPIYAAEPVHRPEPAAKICFTQLKLTDDVERGLIKLDVKIASRARDCTHLIAKHIGRTEKFLCAMAGAPFIVTEEWAQESAGAKSLLPADEFLLSDPANEKKWKFKLVDAVKRAKQNKGQIFKGIGFYVTTRVLQGLEKNLLRNVVEAHGGWWRSSEPTVRMLKTRRDTEKPVVISCKADISIWRPLEGAGFTIYNKEFLLNGALTQELRWDDQSCQKIE